MFKLYSVLIIIILFTLLPSFSTDKCSEDNSHSIDAPVTNVLKNAILLFNSNKYAESLKLFNQCYDFYATNNDKENMNFVLGYINNISEIQENQKGVRGSPRSNSSQDNEVPFVCGFWKDDSTGLEMIISIVSGFDSYAVITTFHDDSKMVEKFFLVDKKDGNIKIKSSEKNDYFIIKSDGNLDLYDEDGYIRSATKFKK